MNITITLNTENDAFDKSEGREVSRILHKLADEFEADYLLNPDGESGSLRDINGNTVGGYVIK